MVIGQTDRRRWLAELAELVRIPSVSSQPRHAADVRRCAAWLADHLRRIGVPRVDVLPTPGHPLVRAVAPGPPGSPTVLVYGHYDVQPVEPLDEWRSPPFSGEIRGDWMLGRGASDDKGPLFAHVKALETFLRRGGPPVTVKLLLDGEEEIGNPHLEPFLKRHVRSLAADVALISDTRMLAPDRPAITYGLRGSLAFELEVSGPPRDLHSGAFGGAIHNPLQALCEIIARLHDEQGRIAIPGIYGRVRPVGPGARERLRRDGPSEAEILRDAGVERGWGEPGHTLYERTTIRPALTVNGITGGHQGPGGKGIIPARAVAKLSFRLVPDQTPAEVERQLRAWLKRVAPPTVRVALRVRPGVPAVVIDRRHPAMRAAAAACCEGFGAPPVFLRSGGSIPVVEQLQRILGIPTVLLGLSLPGDRIHAPNERFYLPNFFRGIVTSRRFLERIARANLVETPQSVTTTLADTRSSGRLPTSLEV
jgi:acetylornithine deacetylase/succinyl-diaminopimelate desuccinylase-like protein